MVKKYLTRESRISMEKTVFSIKGAGKIGYSQVKRIKLDLSYSSQKLSQNGPKTSI